MKKLHLVMPMGGGGTRFGNKGFNVPKPLIPLQGKPFFYWAVQSVLKFVDVADIIFVVLQDHIDRFSIDKEIHKYYPDAIIKVIPEVLNGAVLTCSEAITKIDDDGPILFNDCDHAFFCHAFYDFCKEQNFEDVDAALLTFPSDSPNFSYVRFNENHKVIGTIEKEVVSNEAICGAYYFKNASIFSNAVISYLEHCNYSEFFVSGLYNEMTEIGRNIITFPTDEHISFGTPDEYDQTLNDTRLGALEQ